MADSYEEPRILNLGEILKGQERTRQLGALTERLESCLMELSRIGMLLGEESLEHDDVDVRAVVTRVHCAASLLVPATEQLRAQWAEVGGDK